MEILLIQPAFSKILNNNNNFKYKLFPNKVIINSSHTIILHFINKHDKINNKQKNKKLSILFHYREIKVNLILKN